LGIRERRIVTNELTSDLAAQAALRALKSAGLAPDEIDLIIVATSTPDRLAPSTACIVQDKIKLIKP
jgi:3-oxoacyl-[acyl-carrier-protein] synthase-3